MKILIIHIFYHEIRIINVDFNNIKKMTLKVLFMSDLWLGVIDLNNAYHLKKE